jgi:molybdate transport system regulatory protein
LLKEEHTKFLQRLQERTDIDKGTFNDIGRLGLQISARNQIQGIVKEIHRRKVNAEIVLKLKSGHELRSIITNSAVESLNLKVEEEVMGIFKASSVFMCKEARYGNVFLGKIKQIFLGDERMELILDIGEEETVVSVMSLDIVDATSFNVGDKAYALIQAYDVMIGR